MKIVVELNEKIIEALAETKATQNAYDRLSDLDNNLTDMYAVAFSDGMKYMAELMGVELNTEES